jgi:hypothetical protein
MTDLSVSEARRLGFALQAHALTMASDTTRPILASILVEPCDGGFTITSTDSYVCFHTQHFVEQSSSGSQLAEAFRLAPNPNGPKPANIVRDLGKALATCGLPVRVMCDADRVSFFVGDVDRTARDLVHVPVDVAPAKDFPNYRQLFAAGSVRKVPVPDPDTGKVPELNRGVVAGAFIVMRIAKLQALAVKAAKVGNAGEALLVMEPNGTGLGPVPFFFTVAKKNHGAERWNGIFMPVRYDFAGDRDFLIPAAANDPLIPAVSDD